jgi:hypothetical protein
LLVLPVVAAFSFIHLLREPDSLIVDGTRPSVDHARRSHERGLGNDLTHVFLPRYDYIIRNIAARGRVPFWDASGFAGRPLLGNPQAGLCYPPVWLAWRAARPSALGWLTVAHLVWAGAGVYVLGRHLGLERIGAAVAAGCFQACPYLIAHTFEGHYPHVWSASWYPWAFWGYALVRCGNAAGAIVLPMVLALSLLAGHPQEWYFLVVALFAWGVWDVVRHSRGRDIPQAGFRVATWVGLGGLSLALCAFDVLPQLAAHPWTLQKIGTSAGHVTRYSLHWLNLAQLLNPLALGGPSEYFGTDNYWETLLSFGLAPLVLAVLGAWRSPRRRMVGGWILLVFVSVVLAGGRRLGLYAIAYDLLPGLDHFRVPSRTLFLASLGVAVLAGAGVDVASSSALTDEVDRKTRKTLRRGLVAVALALPVLCVAGGLMPGQGDLDTFPARGVRNSAPLATQGVHLDEWRAINAVASQPVVWVVLGSLWLGLCLGRTSRSRSASGWLLATLALVELAWEAQSVLVVAPACSFARDDALALSITCQVNEPTGPYRVAALEEAFSDLDAARQGLEKTNVNDTFQLQHAADLYESLYSFLDPVLPPRARERPMDVEAARFRAAVAQSVLDRFCVRFLVTDRLLDLPQLEVENVDDSRVPSAALLRNPSALPRAYVVPRSTSLARDGSSAAADLARIDARQFATLSRDPLSLDARQPFKPADWRSDDPDRIVVGVETEAPGLLVVANTWMPGWTASVDGVSQEVLKGNHAQQVVPLPSAGPHEVVLSYRPPGYVAGCAVSLAALGVWATLCVRVAGRLRAARPAV